MVPATIKALSKRQYGMLRRPKIAITIVLQRVTNIVMYIPVADLL